MSVQQVSSKFAEDLYPSTREATRVWRANNSVNRPLVDTGWRVGMPTGSNPRSAELVQEHAQYVKGAIAGANAFQLSTWPNRHGLVRPKLIVTVRGYGVFGK